MSNNLGLPECHGIPERKEGPTVFEYVAAEWWVRERYGIYFRSKFPVPNLITWQLDRFYYNYDKLGDPVLEFVMDKLVKDFNNPLNPRLKDSFYKLMKAGSSADQLKVFLKEITPGGALKPDMLGISAQRILCFDAVEVGTVKTAKSTWDELNHKLGVIKDVIIPQLKIELPNLSITLGRGQKSVSVPTDFSVKGSSFRMNSWERILPLPINFSKNGNVRYADWICYHPTMTWQPPDAPMSTPGPEGPQGNDGLVIYHIHRLPIPKLPDKVRQHFEIELRKWRQGHGLVLELNPAYAYAFKQSKSDWSPEAKLLFGYFGVGALVVMGVALAWELGLIAGAAALAEGGLNALMASPLVFTQAMEQSAVMARSLWLAGASVAPLLPIIQ